MVGILSYGAYVPRSRLQRASVAAAHAWYNPGLRALARGERAMAGWDEDSLTMAVEAARDCLGDLDRGAVSRVVLASTTAPFADRQNAGVVKEALNLPDDVGALDVGGSQRAGSSALIDALLAARGGEGDVLCVAAERRISAPASEQELTAGDAAAAFLVGEGETVADLVAAHSTTVDFVDHFRAAGQGADYGWESRWVRDEGYAKLVPAAIAAALAKAGLQPGDVSRFVMAAPFRGLTASLAKAAGLKPEAVADPLDGVVGDAGCAHPLLMLAHALETAKAGEVLLVVGFGQGCDVLVLRATGRAAAGAGRLGVSGWMARRRPEDNYLKFLAHRGQLALERGMRAEQDQKTALTALYRNRKAVLALVGGRCTQSGLVQFPKTPISAAGNMRAVGTQEDYPLADRVARIVTHTADRLAYSPDPPSYYGTIDFEGGGRMTVDFADVEAADVEVGRPMRMMFRIKAVDELRGFTKYFWKATPDYRAAAMAEMAANEER
jgi:3-hydroxy-3-methylglutaryl CoA synthase